MSEEERDPGSDPDHQDMFDLFVQLAQGLEIAEMMEQGLVNALHEFVEQRWPHLERHGVVGSIEESGDNPFSEGATPLFMALVEIHALNKVFTQMLQDETLPDALCPLATQIRLISTAVSEAEFNQHLQHEAVIPPDPSMN